MTTFFVLAAVDAPAFSWASLGDSAFWAMIVEWSLRVVYAALILVVGLWLAFFISGLVRKRLTSVNRLDKTLARFFANVTRYALVAIVLIAVLQKFGVQTTSLVAMLGAATLAIGLALQGTLSNVAAGALIAVFRPYRLGDWIDIGGKSGSVEDITLFYTALNTFDNHRVVVPNGQAWGGVIENFSVNQTRRMDLTVGISYEDNIDRAIEIVRRVVLAHPAVHREPAPTVQVRALGASSVDLAIRAWTDNSAFGDAQWDLLKQIKEAFDREGVTIPYPTQLAINRLEPDGKDEAETREVLEAEGKAPEAPEQQSHAPGQSDAGQGGSDNGPGAP